MKIVVDRSVCSGHARCAQFAPTIYQLDEFGHCAVEEADVPSGLEDDARRGADNCPERAISVIA